MVRRLGIVLVLLLGCGRPPVDILSPESAPPPSLELFVEAQPLACDGTLTAIIGDRGIELAAFEDIYVLKQRKYSDRGREIPKSADARYHLSISERVIHQELLALEAAKLGLDYDPVALEQRERTQRRSIDDWDAHLRRRGESEESLRQFYIAEQRERAIIEASGALTITDEEVLAEYDQIAPNYDATVPRVHAAHVLVAIDDDTSEADALALAKTIHQLALQPATDFARLAEEWSDDPSAREGGDLGILAKGQMVEEFDRVAFKLAPGEISAPTRTQFGYHVVKVYGAWGPGRLPLEALEAQIRERLLGRKLRQGRRGLQARLLDAYAPINCIPPLMEQRGLPMPPARPPSEPSELDSEVHL